MYSTSGLTDFSRKEFNPLINQLKMKIKCLSTDLTKFKLLSNNYEKYFDYLNEINKNIASNNELLDLSEKIKSLNEFKTNIKVLKECKKSCFVSLEKLTENQFNHFDLKSETNATKTIVETSDVSTQTQSNDLKTISPNFKQIWTAIEIAENSDQLNAEEVSDNDSEGIDCDINYTNLSKDETIDENNDQNYAETQEKIESTERVEKENISVDTSVEKGLENENQNEVNEEETQFESQITIEKRRRKLGSISGESEDNDIECNDNSYTDVDYYSDEELSDNLNDENRIQTKNNTEETEKLIVGNELNVETNNHKSKLRFECLWSGCEQSFNDKRGLNLHTLRKHKNMAKKSKAKQQNMNSNEELNQIVSKKSKANNDNESDDHSNQSDSHYDRDVLSAEDVSDNESTHQLFYEKKPKGRPSKQINYNKTNEKFMCLWSGCEQSFNDKRGLNLHTLRKHKYVAKKSKANQQNMISSETLNQTTTEVHLNKEIVSNKSLLTIESSRSFRKRNTIIDIECNDSSDTDCDSNDKQISDNSKDKSKHKKSDRKYVCDYDNCGKTFKTNRLLNCHKETHSQKPKYKCDLDDCSAVFKSYSSLCKHRIKHTERYKCEHKGCQYRADSKHQLKTHERIHSKERPFLCEKCGSAFKDQYAFISHKKALHPDLFPDLQFLKCDQNGCEFKTKDPTSFRAHTYIHTRRFVCEVCQKGFAELRHFSEHMRNHKGIKLVCNTCQKTFSTIAGLKLHTKSLHSNGKKFICDVEGCHKSYVLKYRLKNHKKTHDKNYKHCKPDRPFNCEWSECGQKFTGRSLLADHMNTHTGEKPYRCDWPGCDKSYSLKLSWTMHKTRHKDYMYRCVWPECDYGTNNSVRLKTHQNKHQNIDNND